MVKKLTIGSLRYDRLKSTVSINQPVYMERSAVNGTNSLIEMEQNQRSFKVEIKKGQSILDAAIEQNVTLDYSCKKGTCGKCKVKLLNGNTYLQPANHLEEKKLHHLIQRGFRLACQAKAR
jgi:ferredoxin, 2Fe-2S